MNPDDTIQVFWKALSG